MTQEIIDAIAYIRSFTHGMSQDSARLHSRPGGSWRGGEEPPDSLKQREEDVERRETAGLRDVLVHHYFGVDLETVWDVISGKLDSLDRAAWRLRDHS